MQVRRLLQEQGEVVLIDPLLIQKILLAVIGAAMFTVGVSLLKRKKKLHGWIVVGLAVILFLFAFIIGPFLTQKYLSQFLIIQLE
jgi:hypothetical protein